MTYLACKPSSVQLRRRIDAVHSRSRVTSLASALTNTSCQQALHRPALRSTFPSRQVTAAAAASTAAGQPLQPSKPTPAATPAVGVKVLPALFAIAVGLAIRYLIPVPAAVTTQAWSLLAIFVSTIVGLVLEPMPVGAWAFCSLTVTVLTKTLPFNLAFSAFNNEVIWLIVVSFFFAKGFEKTGLGERVANLFVKALGKSTLGLAYGLAVAETMISPAMPSTSARAGGVFMPIIASLAKASGSLPGETANKVGNFLVHCQMQCSTHSSVLFLTAAAQNLLCMKLAADAGAVVGNAWVTWVCGAIAPSLVCLLCTPLIVYKLSPPEVTSTPEAPMQADKRLKEMGPVTKEQKIMIGTMALAVALWITGDMIGVSSVVAAMLGLSLLLVTGVLSWRDCLTYSAAWDTLTWFAVLVGMSGCLNTLGVIRWLADSVGGTLAAANLPWPALCGLLNLAYYFLHYMFASQTAHVGALYSAFIVLMLQGGVPPLVAALSLAYNSNLFGAITHYSSGQSAVYYGSNYMKLPEVFRNGLVCGAFTLLVWATVGTAWWKLIGFA